MFNFSLVLSHKAKEDVSVTEIHSCCFFFFPALGLPRRMTESLLKRILGVLSSNPHNNSSVHVCLKFSIEHSQLKITVSRTLTS